MFAENFEDTTKNMGSYVAVCFQPAIFCAFASPMFEVIFNGRKKRIMQR